MTMVMGDNGYEVPGQGNYTKLYTTIQAFNINAVKQFKTYKNFYLVSFLFCQYIYFMHSSNFLMV